MIMQEYQKANNPKKCLRCGGEMRPGKAITFEIYSGIPDFPGGEVYTFSESGPGKLIDCMKCADCGWSITKE